MRETERNYENWPYREQGIFMREIERNYENRPYREQCIFMRETERNYENRPYREQCIFMRDLIFLISMLTRVYKCTVLKCLLFSYNKTTCVEMFTWLLKSPISPLKIPTSNYKSVYRSALI